MKINALGAYVGNVGNVHFLQILRSAPLTGSGVGNVGNTYRFPTSYAPAARPFKRGSENVG